MKAELPQVYLARHGETEWSLSGRHTGTTDLPLTPNGEAQARALGDRIKEVQFDRVWTSPRTRAIRTAELAGLANQVEVAADLAEWNYGEYEGLTSDQIHARDPNWLIYRDGCPGGESVEAVQARADRVVARLRASSGTSIVFSHGHFTRLLAVRWLGLPILDARYLMVGTAALGTLGCDGDLGKPVIELWNEHRYAKI